MRTPKHCTTSSKPQITSTESPRTAERWMPSSRVRGCCMRMVKAKICVSLFRLIPPAGDAHKRQRKSMMPAFGLTTSRELLPRFIEVVDKASLFRSSVLGLGLTKATLVRGNVERPCCRFRQRAGGNRCLCMVWSGYPRYVGIFLPPSETSN